MSACDVIKAVVCFYRVDSDAEFERLRSHIPINNDLQTVESCLMKKHLVAFLDFLGLKELATKYGIGGKTENFAINTDGQWQLELLIMLAEETSSVLNGISYFYDI